MDLRGEAEHTVTCGKWWASLSKSLLVFPSFLHLHFGLCKLFNFTAFREPVCEPWLHWPLPHRPRLCLINWTVSYNETKTLKPWVLKSVGKILWSTWVCGAVGKNPGDMFPRKWIQASPLVWAVRWPVKVFLPGKVLPWLIFQQKGMIYFWVSYHNKFCFNNDWEWNLLDRVLFLSSFELMFKKWKVFAVIFFYYCGIHFYIVKCSHLAYKSVSTDKWIHLSNPYPQGHRIFPATQNVLLFPLPEDPHFLSKKQPLIAVTTEEKFCLFQNFI